MYDGIEHFYYAQSYQSLYELCTAYRFKDIKTFTNKSAKGTFELIHWITSHCLVGWNNRRHVNKGNSQCPVNWKQHDSCTGHLIFEQDLNSLYEKGELNLAVDCKGNVLTWKMEFSFHIIKSFAMRQRSRRDTFKRKKPDDERKNSSD